MRLTADLPEVAKMLGCSLRHLRELDAKGQLPFVRRLGRRKVVPLAALEKWLQDEQKVNVG